MKASYLLPLFLLAAFTSVEAKSIKIASGNISGLYYQTAAYICEAYKKEYKEDCQVIETSGSQQNMELLKNGIAQAALVQGTYTVDEFLIVKRDLYKEYFIAIYKSNKELTLKETQSLKYYVDEKSGVFKSLQSFQEMFQIEYTNRLKILQKDQFNDFCYGDIDLVFFHVGYPSSVIDSYLVTCTNARVLSIQTINIDQATKGRFQGIETKEISDKEIKLPYSNVKFITSDKETQRKLDIVLNKYAEYLKISNRHLAI